jgi:hypothetical protein
VTAKTIAKALGGRKACCSWMARCPTHKDRTPSLAITDTTDGNVLVRSHAGYRQCNVIEAVRGRGLWESTCRPNSSPRITAWQVENIHWLIESTEQRYAGVETRLRAATPSGVDRTPLSRLELLTTTTPRQAGQSALLDGAAAR